MCGICGVFNFGTGEPADPVALKRATDTMVHRGPDDEGFHLDGALGLGNRRLSIIDLPGGHQPICNEDDSVWITFNGEIYNYRELRPDLLARGHKFRTNSDTETILHLYEEHDLAFLDHLRGMFALAIWDSRKRRLLLARDRLGVKPLYYRLGPGCLAFASELRSLRELLPQPLEIEPQSIYDFFGFRYIPAPRTFYRGVEKLLPGHFLVADSRGTRSQAYWDIPAEEEMAKHPKEIAAEVVELLRQSVRLRLISDVPLGVFLSGGTDSSAVVAFMAELGARPVCPERCCRQNHLPRSCGPLPRKLTSPHALPPDVYPAVRPGFPAPACTLRPLRRACSPDRAFCPGRYATRPATAGLCSSAKCSGSALQLRPDGRSSPLHAPG